jgi:hypothetical protein
MEDNDAGWVPRPVPQRMLYVEQIRRGMRVLVGHRGKTTVQLREDGTYTRHNADGSYSTGRWSK